jgi:hypothetical protein
MGNSFFAFPRRLVGGGVALVACFPSRLLGNNKRKFGNPKKRKKSLLLQT